MSNLLWYTGSFGFQFGIWLANLCITGQHQLAVLGDVAGHLVLCGATGSNIGAQKAELPLLLQTCFWAAPSANSLEKVKWSLISWPSGPFNKKASGWMNHLMAKNASKQSSGDLANTSFHS